MSQAQFGYYFYRLMGSLAPLASRRFGYWLAGKIGYAGYFLNPSGSAVLTENLSHVLGREADAATLRAKALQVYGNLAKNYFDLFYNHSLSEQEASALVSIQGVHHAERALKKGRGLVFTSAHFGPFDAAWQIGPVLDLTITAPAEHLKPERLYQYVCKLRAASWMRLLPVDGPLFGLFRALRRGEAVAVAADRDITRSGIVVDFFDAPARLPDGHVQLALRTGAELITCFALRQADNSPIVQVEPPLELEQTGNFERDVRVNVQKVVARMEHWISRYPEQWPMLHPIWRDDQHGS
jgi:KDO2-lipid IV(A) lauroyltransferase